MSKPSVFVRHGRTGPEPDPDKPGETLGISKWGLTDEGKAQAAQTARDPFLHDADILIISSEKKAQQTAEYLKEELRSRGKEFIVIEAPEIHELDRDEGGHMERDEYEKTARQALENPETSFKKWEKMADAYKRFSAKVADVERMYPDKKKVFFGHGYTMGWHRATLKKDFENVYDKIHGIGYGDFAVVVDGEVVKDFGEKIEDLGRHGEKLI